MNLTSQYILACRTLLTLQQEDLVGRDDLMRHILKLRQLLQCRVCRGICQDPLSSEACQHLVCYGCLRGKISSNSGCRFCRNVDELKHDSHSRLLVLCYRKMCQLVMKSSLSSIYKPENGERNRLWVVIQEGNSYDQIKSDHSDAYSSNRNPIETAGNELENTHAVLLQNTSNPRTFNAGKVPDDRASSIPARKRGRRQKKTNYARKEPIVEGELSHDSHEFSTLQRNLDSSRTGSPRRKRANQLQSSNDVVAPIKVKVLRVNDEARYRVANDSDCNRENHEHSYELDKEGTDFAGSQQEHVVDTVNNKQWKNEIDGVNGENQLPGNISCLRTRENSPKKFRRGRRRRGSRRSSPVKQSASNGSRSGKSPLASDGMNFKTLKDKTSEATTTRNICQECECEYCKGEDPEKLNMKHCVGDCCTSSEHLYCNGKNDSEEEVEILN